MLLFVFIYPDNNEEIVKYELEEDFSIENALKSFDFTNEMESGNLKHRSWTKRWVACFLNKYINLLNL